MFEDRQILKSFFLVFALVGLIILIVVDARQHFDSDLIELKKKNHSAQRNWNPFFGQSNVYLSGGMRYQEELNELVNILEPNTAIFSDMATSYYLASALPVYVKNVHAHHGQYKSPEWNVFINKRFGCYLYRSENMDKFVTLLSIEPKVSARRGVPTVRYMVVNKDEQNSNVRRECFLRKAAPLSNTLTEFAEKVYEGPTLSVFRLPIESD